jgi:acylphosphatase
MEQPLHEDDDAFVGRHLRITGRVQGVGYRDAFCEVAERAGVTGWVRNRADGSVEAVVLGPVASVDAVIDWARRGPPVAGVTGVDVSSAPKDPGPAPKRFERRPSA